MTGNPATRGPVTFHVANHVALIVLMILMIYPFIFVLSVSVSDWGQITANRVWLWPRGPLQTLSYGLVLHDGDILASYVSSTIHAVGTVALTLTLTSLAAYVLNQRHFAFRTSLVFFMVLAMFLPGFVVPTILLFDEVGLRGARLAAIPASSLNAWYILVMRANVHAAVTTELREAAAMDGANHLQVFARVAVPLIKPILAAICLFAATASWKASSWSVISPNDADHLILPEGIMDASTRVEPGLLQSMESSAAVIAMMPILVVYPFLQRWFTKGVARRSVTD